MVNDSDFLEKEKIALLSKVGPVVTEVLEELLRASRLFGPFASPHEGYAILLEEVEELWDDIKNKRLDKARVEAVQVAAMALRFCMDLKE